MVVVLWVFRLLLILAVWELVRYNFSVGLEGLDVGILISYFWFAYENLSLVVAEDNKGLPEESVIGDLNDEFVVVFGAFLEKVSKGLGYLELRRTVVLGPALE
jgi:hypothetical protein